MKRNLPGEEPDVGSEGKRRRGRQRTRWLDSLIEATNMKAGGSGRQEGLACCGPWGHKESDMT